MIVFRQVNQAAHYEVNLWVDFDLAIVMKNESLSENVAFPMSSEDRDSWKNYILEGTEFSPPRMKDSFYDRYFILFQGQVIGSYAIPSDLQYFQHLKIQSLYIKPEFRNKGVATSVLNQLMDISNKNSLMGLSL